MSDPAQYPLLSAISSARSTSNTPVASYIPSGVHDSPLPMGKYYPSNYEKKNSSAATLRPASATPPGPTAVKSESQVPRYRGDASHSRSDSEAKRRLLQYQRDMIAQATLAANQVMGGVMKKTGHRTAQHSVHGMSLNSIQLGAPMVHKPKSPRLHPLGSPGGLVTPMDLTDGEDGGYLTRGRPVAGPDADRERDEIARALRVEKERRRREGATSPAMEQGQVIF